MKIHRFFEELKRRNVIKSSLAYFAFFWLMHNVINRVSYAFEIGHTFERLSIIFALSLFPFWVIFSWYFEYRDGHFYKTPPLGEHEEAEDVKSNVQNVVIIGALSLLVLILIVDKVRTTKDNISSMDDRVVSVAALPFKNIGDRPQNQEIIDGMMEDINTQLSSIPALKVISKNSTQKLQDQDKTITEMAKELGITNILEGSVQTVGDNARISVKLIDVLDDSYLWAEKFDRDVNDIFSVQSEVAKKVAQSLLSSISAEVLSEIDKIPTTNNEAYQLYVTAKKNADNRSKEGVAQAVTQLRKAISLDPQFSDAYAELAAQLFNQGYYQFEPDSIAFAEAKKYSDLAIDINPNAYKAHSVLGDYYFLVEGNIDEAEKMFLKALSLNPNDVTSHHHISFLYGAKHDEEKRLFHLQKASELDPLSLIINAAYIQALAKGKNFSEAEPLLNRMNDLFGEDEFMDWVRGEYFSYKNDYKTALPWLRKAAAHNPAFEGSLGYAYGQVGKRDSAYMIINDLEDNALREINAGFIYIGVGELDSAIYNLQLAVEKGNGSFLLEIDGDPQFEPLKKHPEYTHLIESIKK